MWVPEAYLAMQCARLVQPLHDFCIRGAPHLPVQGGRGHRVEA